MAGYGALYVGDLHPDVTEAILFETFSKVGPVATVRVCRDVATRRSLGYGYVNFLRVEDAEKALEVLNFKQILGKLCRVMWSQRDPSLRKSGVGNIFVKNLSPSIDNKTLYDTFSLFGNILSCKVVTDANGKSLKYGFVHYETEEAAQDAILRVDGKSIASEQVTVERFKTKKDRSSNKDTMSEADKASLFVKNFPVDKKEALSDLFVKHGEIAKLVVKESVRRQRNGEKLKYAVINFPSPEQAQAALELHNTDFQGSHLHVERYKTKQELAEKFKWTNLYVKNFPVDVKEEELLALFGQHGEINRHTFRDYEPPQGNGGGKKLKYAFINFALPEQAQAALELHNTDFQGSRLYVVRALPKPARQKQVEEQRLRRKEENQQTFANNNLFVKNLADTVDAARLREEFSKVTVDSKPATIISAVVALAKGTHKSRGFGFVCYETPAEATAAIAMFNSAILEGKNLFVGPYQRKSVRLAYLYQQRGGGRKYPQQQGYMEYPLRRFPYPYPQQYPQQFPQFQQYSQQAFPQQAYQQAYPQAYPQQYQPQSFARRPTPQTSAQSFLPHFKQPGQGPQVQKGSKAIHLQPRMVPQVQTQQRTRAQRTRDVTAMPPDEQKQWLGERLFPLIQNIAPAVAGKVTGMLLEMGVDEIMGLLQDENARVIKVQEAISVLEQSQGRQDHGLPRPE